MKNVKKDIIIFVTALVFASALFFILSFMNKGEAVTVIVTQKGDKIGEYSLYENKEIILESELGRNVVCIEGGSVYMKESDCVNQICVNDGKKSELTDIIVCLPHEIIIEVK